MTVLEGNQRPETARHHADADFVTRRVLFTEAEPALLREWEALAAEPLHPNPFYTPAALDALLAADPSARDRLQLICLYRTDGPGRGRLVGLLPWLRRGARIGWRRGGVNYTSPYLPCGTPLIARDAPPGWAERLIHALSNDAKPALLRHVPLSGPIGDALLAALRETGATWRPLDPFARPVATPSQSYEAFTRRAYGRNRRKGIKRLRNALSADATLTLESRTDPQGCAAATGPFLALEAGGWKGAGGTALAQKDATRTMLARLFRPDLPPGSRRVDQLLLDGRPIAISMSLVQDGTAFLWKTAYDEALRRHAPGIVLEDAIVQALHAEPALRGLDSCTLAASPLQDLYDERLEMADLVIAPGWAGAALIAAEQERRAMRRRVAGWLRRRRG